jgi:hypothetical protein
MTTITTSIDDAAHASIVSRLAVGNERFASRYPGEVSDRQPVHTVYGGAQLYKSTSTGRMGQLALTALDRYAPSGALLADALGWTGHARALAPIIHERVVDKLNREAVEDFRIDFEDGYGNRPDAEEDAEAQRTAREVAEGMKEGTLPPFIGIRIKPFTAELHARGLRTLDIFVTTLAEATGGRLPDNFIVTLPKVTVPEQVEACVLALEALEARTELSAGSLRLELMVETPQAILDATGRMALPGLVDAAKDRIRGVHFGTYDYTALAGVTAALQSMDHPSCDFARDMMQVALAQRGLQLSDGATNIMPVGPHRGADLTSTQEAENRAVVHNAWRIAHEHIRHSLERAYYQGWDLHPAQLPIRYATVYGFFLEGLDAATERLSSFIEKAGQATLVGDVFDDAATGQGLLNTFLRALGCGAITEAEALATGVTLDEFRGRSFLRIVESRREV